MWFDAPAGLAGGKVKRKQDEPLRLSGSAAVGAFGGGGGGLPAGGVQDIRCGASFNAALLKDGSVRTWGLGEVGELGRPVGPMRDATTKVLGSPHLGSPYRRVQFVLLGAGACLHFVQQMGGSRPQDSCCFMSLH